MNYFLSLIQVLLFAIVVSLANISTIYTILLIFANSALLVGIYFFSTSSILKLFNK
jgi:hypothetical protein